MSTKIVIKTTDRVVPMIYAYTTPEIARHNGWTKIGYTEQDVDKRLNQQAHTADVEYKEEWRGNATFEDGSGDTFTDKDFHRYLRKLNIENDPKNEWFHVTGPVSRNHFYDFRSNRGILQTLTAATPYNLREEQEDAVEKTLDYSRLHTKGEYLWNAKPRFGKTLTAYELCKQMDADTVLIVTNRPAIANSWYSDYEKFLGPDSGYLFVSDTSSLQGKPFVVTRKQYLDMLNNDDYKCIEFVSLQDLKGSIYFGGEFEKLKEVNDIHWDVLIIDEAHEGVDTYKTDVAFDHIERNFTLHLSGTPFEISLESAERIFYDRLDDAIRSASMFDETEYKAFCQGSISFGNKEEAQKKKEIYNGIVSTVDKVVHDNERLILRLDSLAYALNQRSAQNPWDTEVVLAMSKLDAVINKTTQDIKQDEDISREAMKRYNNLKGEI